MPPDPAGAPSKKRKRNKQPRAVQVATAAQTSHVAGSGAGFGADRHDDLQFIIGTERPAPSSRLQLAGLDDQQRRAAVAALEKFGLVHFTDTTLPLDFLGVLTARAFEVSEQIEEALVRRGVQYQHNSAHSAAARAIEHNHSFKFEEVASRCLGRLDIRYGMQTEPFSDGLLTHNPFWRPIVQDVLGDGARLEYAGLVLNLPGSAMQAWHVDGGHLFGRKCECPAHCLDVFIPLIDVPAELGPTEFIPRTHTLAGAVKVETVLDGAGPEAVSKSQRYKPALTAGTAILYDHRLIHRGTPNLTDDIKRPMLYLMYSKPWFREVKNFDDLDNEQLLEELVEAKGAHIKGAAKSRTNEKKSKKRKKRKKKGGQHQQALRDSGVVGPALFSTATATGVAADTGLVITSGNSSGNGQGSAGKPTALAALFG